MVKWGVGLREVFLIVKCVSSYKLNRFESDASEVHSMKTKSENIFENFLTANDVKFEKIQESSFRTPNYLVSLGDLKLVFELKELGEHEKSGIQQAAALPPSRIVGDHVRRRIEKSKKQIQYGAKQGIPSILLIYNNLDPDFQMFGTEDHDFSTAMYGEITVLLNKNTRGKSDWFNGKNQLLQENKNTSFSAVGRLCDYRGKTTVTLFENVFSKLKIPFEQLPHCFEVIRTNLSTDPLVVT